MKAFDFSIPTRIIFGLGRIAELAKHIPMSTKRIMLVSEQNLFQHSQAVQKVLEQLNDFEVDLFLEVEENPSFETVERAGHLAREANCDLIIGVGGGSPMDAAKGVAMVATNSLSLRNLIGVESLPNPPLPVICIPTTSGTGSEVTPYAVFTDRAGGNKCGYGNDLIFPVVSILDPELTFSMPKSVVVNTGLDALTHSIEAYLSTLSNPFNDLMALESIERVITHLPGAAKGNEEDLAVMAYASMLGGIAITHGGTILLHIMAYPLTVYHGIPHGKANAILLPAVLDFLRIHSNVKDKIERIDDVFTPLDGITSFINGLGVSTKLADYGIQAHEFDGFAEKVIVKGDIAITPAEVSREDIKSIYQSGL